MSRLGKKEIEIPKGVTVTQDNGVISVAGPKHKIAKKDS